MIFQGRIHVKQLYVIRHCSATGQLPDAPLTVEGVDQANKLTNYLIDKSIESIICSPYVRARQTIEPFAGRADIPVRVEPRLVERVLSKWDLNDWLKCLEQTFDDFDLAFEGGESSQTAMDRAVEVVQEILLSGPDKVAIVTHGNLMILLLKQFNTRFGFQDWARLSNPDVFMVTTDGVRTTVERTWT